MWAHRATGLFTITVEIGAPFLMWGPRWLRPLAFALMAGFQIVVLATGNYGFFNCLSLALCLWILDDGHLPGGPASPVAEQRQRPAATVAMTALTVLLVPLTLLPFLPFVGRARPLARALLPVSAAVEDLRSINAYHLFAQMTLVRREPVIEGSDDGVTWRPYELRYEPGDVDRAPPFVAPHQPRVDFQIWFLLLGRGLSHWFLTLLDRMRHDPAAVAPLFARDPFGGAPPRFLRLAIYRYRFTDAETRARTGAWWTRDLEGVSRPIGE